MSIVEEWKTAERSIDAALSHPSGVVDLAELDDAELAEVEAGGASLVLATLGCCWCVPWGSNLWTICFSVGCDFRCSN